MFGWQLFHRIRESEACQRFPAGHCSQPYLWSDHGRTYTADGGTVANGEELEKIVVFHAYVGFLEKGTFPKILQ